MGGCVSVHKDSGSESKTGDKVVTPSPVKDNGDRPIAEEGGGGGGDLKSQPSPSLPVATLRDFGSKEETFFDSQAWLESDCEDDFLSVNGDCTPSRGSTPVHRSFSASTPRVNTALLDDKTSSSKPEPSPTSKKKLAELFCERGNQEVDAQNTLVNQNGVNGKVEAKTTIVGLPPRTPNGDYRSKKEKSINSVQCCLPRMLSSRSFSERKKKMSPARSIG